MKIRALAVVVSGLAAGGFLIPPAAAADCSRPFNLEPLVVRVHKRGEKPLKHIAGYELAPDKAVRLDVTANRAAEVTFDYNLAVGSAITGGLYARRDIRPLDLTGAVGIRIVYTVIKSPPISTLGILLIDGSAKGRDERVLVSVPDTGFRLSGRKTELRIPLAKFVQYVDFSKAKKIRPAKARGKRQVPDDGRISVLTAYKLGLFGDHGELKITIHSIGCY